MTFIEILLIAVGLCFDTLAVSMIGGACIHCISWWKRAQIISSFALFQGGLTFAGWAVGASVSSYISAFDHWVAFALLAYIGGKMIVGAFSKDKSDEAVDLLNTKTLVVSSIATSIDAAAVGISFAIISFGWKEILFSSLIIALVTALAAATGLFGGEKLGKILGKKCDFVGGVILVAIGVKILLEHLLA